MKRQHGGRWSSDLSPEKREILFKEAFANIGELVILDEKGRMVYISEEYAKYMNVDIDRALGHYITEIIPDSQLPKVLRSRKCMMNMPYHRNGNAFLVNRMPIWHDGKFMGIVAQSILTSGIESEETKNKISCFMQELNYYREKYHRLSSPQTTLDSIVGNSPEINNLKDMVRMVAETKSTVLLSGESGTGKEVFANAIHNLSPRKDKPFIRINCAAIPDNLLESELFGYKEGAFTGALKGGKIGDFEAANGGTLFLDEINSLSMNMQAKLLRVIQEREIKKLGATETTPIDVRLIFATNQDLYLMMQEGKFREDFYYRINIINLHLPALRNRREDIEPLTRFFIKRMNKEMGRQIEEITPAAMRKLEGYRWPGNIRELENCIERAFVYTRDDYIDVRHIIFPEDRINEDVGASESEPVYTGTLKEIREQAEKQAIVHALKRCQGSKKEIADQLGIDRSVLYDKIKRYHLEL